MVAGSHAQWEEIGTERCLVVRFSGHLDVAEARAKMAQIHAALEGVNEPVHMIWDALEMTSYDADARRLWQEGLKLVRDEIRAIHLISESAVIHMGAAVVGMFVGFDIRSWPSREAVRVRP